MLKVAVSDVVTLAHQFDVSTASFFFASELGLFSALPCKSLWSQVKWSEDVGDVTPLVFEPKAKAWNSACSGMVATRAPKVQAEKNMQLTEGVLEPWCATLPQIMNFTGPLTLSML